MSLLAKGLPVGSADGPRADASVHTCPDVAAPSRLKATLGTEGSVLTDLICKFRFSSSASHKQTHATAPPHPGIPHPRVPPPRIPCTCEPELKLSLMPHLTLG